MKQEQLRKNDATAAQLSASLEACVVNAGLLADAQQRLKDLEARLAAKQVCGEGGGGGSKSVVRVAGQGGARGCC